MKWLLVLSVLALTVLKRVIRSSIGGMDFIKAVEDQLVRQCRINGHSEKADNLKDIYKALRICVIEEPIFILKKQEYLTHVNNCAEDAVKETKECLNDKEKFLPDLMLNITDSIITFLYDDYSVLASMEMKRCVLKLRSFEVQEKYFKCVLEKGENEETTLPQSKGEFCPTFIKAGSCLPNTFRDVCENNDKIKKFRADYIAALEKPCEN